MTRPRLHRLADSVLCRMALAGAMAAGLGTTALAATDASPAPDLNQLSIEDLANIDVSSVTKTDQPLSDAPAAVFVITHDDIRRSGATSIAEALRLAPNLQVARLSASRYAISARGFNGTAADKLLVLVDGRSVYATYFSGVFWDVQDLPLDDIERIEVISGPGATLWGANAVNGVINVITRKSSDTQGALLEVAGGNWQRSGVLQFGGKLREDLSWRAYVSGVEYSASVTPTGADARDGWHKYQGGFRFDWTRPADLITLQGDAYDGLEGQFSTTAEAVSGRNVVARWTHTLAGGSNLQLQAYYDELHRSAAGNVDDQVSTYDLDLQHTFSVAGVHDVVWGGGLRVTNDNFAVVPNSALTQVFTPQMRTLWYGDAFVQDSIALSSALELIVGVKLESDPYDGLEPLPSARLSWKVAPKHMLWAAVSRAVRAPSRLEEDFSQSVGSQVTLKGGDFRSEKVIAYEVGYRGQPSAQTSLSVSGFYNVYRDLRSVEPSPGFVLPLLFENRMLGETFGAEVWGAYQATSWWRLTAGFNWLHKNLRFAPDSAALGGVQIAGDDPDYQASLRSTMQIRSDVTLDLAFRDVGDLPAPASPAYAEIDARIVWEITPAVELSLTGSNLLHDNHLEFGSTSSTLQLGDVGVESGRRFSLDARWRF